MPPLHLQNFSYGSFDTTVIQNCKDHIEGDLIEVYRERVRVIGKTKSRQKIYN